MNMPVNFELAKLLKEKGFDEQCSNFYASPRCKMFGIDEHGRYYPIKNKAKTLWISGHAATLDSRHVYYAPTIAEVIMWLYEKHGVWICVATIPFEKHFTFEYSIHNISECLTQDGVFDSPTEAYEEAIEYTLKNLLP